MKFQATIGQFEQLVLTAVVTLGENAYGVTIRDAVSALAAPKSVSLGAVYATLDRLEAKGLVLSRRASVDGLSRRVFALATRGARALAETRAMRDRLWQGVNLRAMLAGGRA